ncbi:Methyltransferase domain-containing protein [Actinokineospora alba]|uniref:Methyltransferase domain-containing protein n=1 Tax=Actinokineospora alba TaxID=504798 RepID=A0A1H0GGW3_9PSEU|nr:methyltransferase domain-containing protein [Actinokineospora alba]TDP69890.1 methyltransferase family protein [Actinokineospora alba]SDI06500.1 Methyltransferase domain-containing protein [Actinokineospora alba]SDO06114.1 Methyltransferase domain-containing protein [Actinokineospora alba]
MAKLWNWLGRAKVGTSWPRSARFVSLVRDSLELSEGDRVLDLGCGAGPDLPILREAVGPGGYVLAIDHSAEMVARAAEMVRKHGWDNVEVRQGDATTLAVSGFDAVLAAFSVSATPDVPAALANARAALRPGGRLFVIDMRLADDTRLNRVLGWIYRRAAGWSGVDVLETARGEFQQVRTPDRLPSWPPIVAFTAIR